MQTETQTVYAFDLDGTITSRELLPEIACAAGIGSQVADLTRQTLSGDVDFESSFKQRVTLLQDISLETIHHVVASIPLDQHITQFIHAHASQCAVVTGNLDCWIEPLISKLACRVFSSIGRVERGRVLLTHILDKSEAIHMLKKTGARVIAIGESANDVGMFQAADVGIAFAGVHAPAKVLLPYADYTVQNGAELCRLLQKV